MGTITDIRKIRNHYMILFDSGEKYLLQKTDLLQNPVSVGTKLDPHEFEKKVLLSQYRKALEKAVSMLAVRACSRGEIETRLHNSGFSDCTVEMILYKLHKESLLDDASFSGQWAEYRFSRHYGPRRIAAELKQKGVSEDLVRTAVESIPEDEQLEQAISIAVKTAKKAKPGEDRRKTRQRAMSAIIRRGYGWEIAKAACTQIDFDQNT